MQDKASPPFGASAAPGRSRDIASHATALAGTADHKLGGGWREVIYATSRDVGLISGMAASGTFDMKAPFIIIFARPLCMPLVRLPATYYRLRPPAAGQAGQFWHAGISVSLTPSIRRYINTSCTARGRGAESQGGRCQVGRPLARMIKIEPARHACLRQATPAARDR